MLLSRQASCQIMGVPGSLQCTYQIWCLGVLHSNTHTKAIWIVVTPKLSLDTQKKKHQVSFSCFKEILESLDSHTPNTIYNKTYVHIQQIILTFLLHKLGDWVMTFPPHYTIWKTISSYFMNVPNELFTLASLLTIFTRDSRTIKTRHVPNNTLFQLFKQKTICLDEPRNFQKNTIQSNTVANICIRCPCRCNVTYMRRPCTAILIRHEIKEKSVQANALTMLMY
jgi:hypothetical protein